MSDSISMADLTKPVQRRGPWAEDDVRIGISACLLGAKVRYDGEHKLDRFLRDTVGQFVKFVTVCPEVEIGLGTPREAIRLERRDGEVRLVGTKTDFDITDKMTRYSRRKARELARFDLSGFILKKNSPSCGMERVKIYSLAKPGQPGKVGAPTKDGVGMFAAGLMSELPLLPVEEEGRLNDPPLRENFFERVFAYRRLTSMFRGRWTVGKLVKFHTAEKFLILAHHPQTYTQLGRLVARAKSLDRQELRTRYSELFMSALGLKASRRTHLNVLQHLAGFFKKQIGKEEKAELQQVLRDYRAGLVPLIVPITLLRHFVRLYDADYLSGQTYLEPHPKELMLRNHV